MTKYCKRCEAEKDVEEFPWRNKSRGTKASWCKPCKQSYESEHYRKSDTRKQQIRNQSQRQVERAKNTVLKYKNDGCVDCGESNPIVLEFDHIEDNKLFNVADRIGRTSLEKLIVEIEKCEVVCANCHRIRTHSRRLSS